ncbi:ubiquitin carboxyl-terminal hydrolase, family 1 [Cucurbitaria berberidis CBS 394.84]|uniref:Ubiquitin carboxyl-terminal hydrolase n=1 Tax=Cucurbitaria berberidis CBS 394.84 TaxID=1168544 RepID=A0A9P4GJ29_9PLEO|nr:ubiquitin carboxyl-terminal hydrolase, family 1 [Cucurbitaria berberidis CBS 394.84]KAF1846086.1 ubiquitin carboxyl-terminal hydrolase, family 1 [Cucurbitaria berberidis CBS 394.84]
MESTETTSTQIYSKHFIPLESNPEVFTELIHKLGLSKSLSFHDVLSLDDPELLAFLPRPVYALILVFPTTAAYEERIDQEEAELLDYQGSGVDEDVVFFKQTINNACGLYAILHAVCNGDAGRKIDDASLIGQLLQAGLPLVPDKLALMLEHSEELELAYAEVATKGDTEAPAHAEDEVDFHYITLVKSHTNSHLYQLDGDRKRPVDHGPMAVHEDVLSDKSLDIIRSMMASEGNNLNFSLMALVEEG